MIGPLCVRQTSARISAAIAGPLGIRSATKASITTKALVKTRPVVLLEASPPQRTEITTHLVMMANKYHRLPGKALVRVVARLAARVVTTEARLERSEKS